MMIGASVSAGAMVNYTYGVMLYFAYGSNTNSKCMTPLCLGTDP